jgi:hypothetical protein
MPNMQETNYQQLTGGRTIEDSSRHIYALVQYFITLAEQRTNRNRECADETTRKMFQKLQVKIPGYDKLSPEQKSTVSKDMQQNSASKKPRKVSLFPVDCIRKLIVVIVSCPEST